jgi:hypothetical protein
MSGNKMKDDFYLRRRFDWGISRMDKDFKIGRYCPLYIKKKVTDNYTGIKG